MVVSEDYIQQILATLARATEANRQTPGRQGNLVVVDSSLADEVMVTGDLHGHRENFDRIRRRATLEECPRRHLVLQEVCHGGPTYPQDGGCMSHALLEEVAALKAAYPDRVHFLLGNHELAELIDFPIRKKGQMLNVQFRKGLQRTYGLAAEAIQDAYRVFFRTCPLAVRLPQGVFISHSIPDDVAASGFDTSVFTRELADDDYAHGGDVFRLLWGRDYRGETRANSPNW
jgi:hypothetical protein